MMRHSASTSTAAERRWQWRWSYCNRESHRSSVFGSPNLGQPMNGADSQREAIQRFRVLRLFGHGQGQMAVAAHSCILQVEIRTPCRDVWRVRSCPLLPACCAGWLSRPKVDPGVPEHSVNLCPRAGDIVFMSEGTSQCAPSALRLTALPSCHACNELCVTDSVCD